MVLSISIIFFIKPAAVTYSAGDARFGDALLTYLHAKWISFLYDIPLLYQPFSYSDQLVMHVQEKRFSQNCIKNLKQVITVKKDSKINFDKNANILYIVPYFPESPYEHQLYSYKELLFNVDWGNPFFKKIIQAVVAPIKQLQYPQIPTDMASIAVHVRTKSGADVLFRDGKHKMPASSGAYSDINFPLKHITNDYYVAQIKRLHDLLGRPKTYVYIFTDDANPPAIKNAIETAVNRPELIFDCRAPGEHHKTGVLDDFFALPRFQFFIGNDSNFSMMASFISDHLITIRPIYDWYNHKVLIDEAYTTVHPAVFSKKVY